MSLIFFLLQFAFAAYSLKICILCTLLKGYALIWDTLRACYCWVLFCFERYVALMKSHCFPCYRSLSKQAFDFFLCFFLFSPRNRNSSAYHLSRIGISTIAEFRWCLNIAYTPATLVVTSRANRSGIKCPFSHKKVPSPFRLSWKPYLLCFVSET